MPELLIIAVPTAAMVLLGKPAHWLAVTVRAWARHRYGL